MKLSTRSTYGMRALVELALASGRGPLSAALIAKRQELSVAYLEQLLHRLRQRGLVTSIRGPRGGYVLARQPHQITMADVVRVLDGEQGNGHGQREHAHSRWTIKNGRGRSAAVRANGAALSVRRQAQRIAETVWRCVHERLDESLSAVTLRDLCEAVRLDAGEPLDHRYVFHI